jgi:lipopolysaccharide export LptBFGC system permease protein LptF
VSHPASARLHLPETIREFAGEYRSQENMSIAEILGEIRRQRGAGREVVWPLVFQLHHRISMATACLAFSLIGAPLSLLFRRGASMGGVLLAILFGFVYYVGMLWARMLGVQGALSPVLAAWLPNAVTVAAGALLLWRRC